MILRHTVLATLGLALSSGAPLAGQWDGLCSTVGPRPDCTVWIVTEVGAEFPLTSTSLFERNESWSVNVRRRDIGSHIVGTFGAMSNHGAGAYGITVSLMGTGGGKDGARAEARFRRSTERGAFQASAGAARWGVHGPRTGSAETATGLTGSIGFDRGWIGANARADFLRTHDRPVHSLSIGAHFGETPARVILKIAAVMALIIRFAPPD